MSVATVDPNRRLADVLATHFDPHHGAPYWLEKTATLGFDPRQEITSINDLWRIGLMDVNAMRNRPIADFIPRAVREQPRDLIRVQTGGTSGHPLWTAYTFREYEEAFVTPFVEAARHVGFPRGGDWLYVGPSGPHIIGRAAESLARASGAAVPFTVDFDTRWAKKLTAGSFAARRYVEHVVARAIDIIQVHPIDVIFTTPVILTVLAKRMSTGQRRRIRGIHYGGMALDPIDLARFQGELFTNAVHLSGYGNTLFGCCLELTVQPRRRLEYFPHGDRLVMGVMDQQEGIPRYDRSIDDGCLVFSRLDKCCLILNFAERDHVRLVSAPSDAPVTFASIGVANPSPMDAHGHEAIVSLY